MNRLAIILAQVDFAAVSRVVAGADPPSHRPSSVFGQIGRVPNTVWPKGKLKLLRQGEVVVATGCIGSLLPSSRAFSRFRMGAGIEFKSHFLRWGMVLTLQRHAKIP